ncbi:DUF2304 domain-containing protein [Kocuria flava]|uniref:DUF2304 domain-containing protein n=1 Tax=Kocuria flava TaxID=446860 RepID=UPI001FF585CB|nr:DUF2304 domain-containing protein [Kocuria flava]MCJ8504456.1 DUF2304 domain-containing protein [Kocuria flava]
MLYVVQILLVLAVGYGALALIRGGANAKHQAIRRVVGLAFFAFAALSIFFPDLLSAVARFLGIGRGTDLVLYGLVVVFMITQATAALRNRQQEVNVTRLARHIAVAEAERPWAPAPEHARRPSVTGFAQASPGQRPAD